MRAFLFKVTLAGGMALTCSGIGYNVDEALMDACMYLSASDFPEDEITDIEEVKV